MGRRRFVAALWLLSCSVMTTWGQEISPPTIDFQSNGVPLPGSQFIYDAAFDVVDWNLDGKPDLFMIGTGMTGGRVHLNEGTLSEPRFGRAINWAYNNTETEPQTIEHALAYTFCDFHQDGTQGLIFFDGRLRYCPNLGTPHARYHWTLWREEVGGKSLYFPGTERFLAENARYSTGPESMFYNKGIFARQVLTLTAGDWDGDGLQDLIICRFKNEAPGVVDLAAYDPSYRREEWSTWGRMRTTLPTPSAIAALKDEDLIAPLRTAPERGLYFYKNLGTREKPRFDEGVEILTPDGSSIAAPNPVLVDLDADGRLDLITCETRYSCNSFRVDWPTAAEVRWHRRPGSDPARLLPAEAVMCGNEPIRSGTMARLADFRRAGVNDLLVLDPGGTMRWYVNLSTDAKAPPRFAPPRVLRGSEFLRFEFQVQPLVVDWFGPGSRDLILHGCTDHHCKWDLRRTALYRNVASRPGELQYEFVGYFNYRGDPALVPMSRQESHYEMFASSAGVFAPDARGRRQLIVSVGGQLYRFSDLADDGLTYQTMTPVAVPGERNRHRGWQEINVAASKPVRYIRVSNDANGNGNLRDSFLHVLRFEAWSKGRNVAQGEGVSVKKLNDKTSPYYQVQNPGNLFLPDNANTDTQFNATSWGYYIGPAVITLPEAVPLDKIRFLLSERDSLWYKKLVPFSWQGKVYRAGFEIDENWYQYKIEVSADEQEWEVVVDRLTTDPLYSHPHPTDWNGDGRTDLLVGVTTGRGSYPAYKTYRLFLNEGTDAEPRFREPLYASNERGERLEVGAQWLTTFGAQCGVVPSDAYGDGRRSLLVEGFDGSLAWYRNVSTPEMPFAFRHDRQIVSLNGQRITNLPYRYFYLGDVDGDQTPDLIDSGFGNLAFYKGVHGSAPRRVDDLAVVEQDSSSLTIRWTRPAGAVTYEIGWSRTPISELTWNASSRMTGTYRGADGAFETARLEGLPAGSVVRIAVRSWGAAQSASGLSEEIEGGILPLRRIVLRNGPAGTLDEPLYDGTEGIDLFTSEATAPRPALPPGVIEVRSQDSNAAKGKEKVILIRFAKLPPFNRLREARLELFKEPAAVLSTFNTLTVTCNQFSTPWERSTVSTSQARAGLPWRPTELERNGTCLSFLEPAWQTQSRRRAWDVTEAVRAALAVRERSVSLLLRVDYTGHYIANEGMRFCGPDHASVADRPRLVLIGE